MPARRKRIVISRRVVQDADMAELLELLQCPSWIGLLPVACVIEAM
jgi:hypothetical protein